MAPKGKTPVSPQDFEHYLTLGFNQTCDRFPTDIDLVETEGVAVNCEDAQCAGRVPPVQQLVQRGAPGVVRHGQKRRTNLDAVEERTRVAAARQVM